MREILRTYVYFLPAYGISLGVLYSWGYWSTFDINIFQYASITDILNSSLIPLGTVLFFAIAGVVAGELATVDIERGSGAGTKVGLFLNKHVFSLGVGWTLIILILILVPHPLTWYIMPVILAFPAYSAAKRVGFLSEIKDDNIRSPIIFILIISPLYCFGKGKFDSSDIWSNEENVIYEVSRERERKYLGHVGGNVFLLTKDNSHVVILSGSEKSKLVLSKREDRQADNEEKTGQGKLCYFGFCRSDE